MTLVFNEVFNYEASATSSSKTTEVFEVKANEFMRYELGFYAAAYYQLNLIKNVEMRNTPSLYSNYLNKPKNIDLNYTALISMKVNKFLTITFQMIYNDNALKGLQIRQILGFGLNYALNKTN